MANAGKGMGGGSAGNTAGPKGHQAPGKPGTTSEVDLADETMGDAGAQGHDPDSLTNERAAQAGVRREPDADPIESFEKMDKDVRAERELGKGARKG